jgi:aminoglycoside 6-adenylyltransferase
VRDAETILSLLVDVAERDERVRAVLLGGSRADPARQPDIFQDYDIGYVVTDIAAFARNRGWAEQFGEILILQQPEDMDDPPPSRDGTWAYLMLFTDGTRIDLTLRPVNSASGYVFDSSSVVLLDKDRALEQRAAHGHDVTPAKAFADCCNEFLWVSTNVAKGLWRGEAVYAKVMFERFVRPQAMRMLDWYLGSVHGHHPGMFGRRYSELLPSDLWELWTRSYSDLDADRSWIALSAIHDVFRATAHAVGNCLGCEYPASDAEAVRAYLARVRGLPRDGTAFV